MIPTPLIASALAWCPLVAGAGEAQQTPSALPPQDAENQDDGVLPVGFAPPGQDEFSEDPDDVAPEVVLDPAAEEEAKGPWRLTEALGLPDWLRISGQIRVRHEGIDGQFRGIPTRSDSDDYTMARSLLKIEADAHERVMVRFEGIDSRQWGASQGSQINNGIVNTTDILQAHLELDLGTAFGGEHYLLAGRYTLDRGSRRLVARNNFRNTINAFDGAFWEWESESGTLLSAFYNLPVQRLPRDRQSLLDNDFELDNQVKTNTFFGGYFERKLTDRTHLELYTYGLDDARFILREHATPGFRVKTAPKVNAFDFELESAFQIGQSELPVINPDVELEHLAWFTHISAGYTFDAKWKPRVRAAWDYASGDRDPNDDENNRFDSLYGGRRFEYGPTSTYGVIARSNLNSPELRLTLKPAPKFSFMTALRGIWLAESTDFWVPAGVRDPSGAAGSHVGDMIEARLRWDVAPKSLRLEFGAAHLFAGRFQKDAPNGRGQDSTYLYFQAIWSF